MSTILTYPPVDKCDFYVKRNDTHTRITGYLADAAGPIDLSSATTVKFAMRASTSTTNKFKSTATIITDPTFTASGATLTSAAHALVNGDRVWVKTSGTLPAGLSASTNYYVVSATPSTLGLSTTKGGTAIVTTSAGTGTHTIIAGRVRYQFTATDTDTDGQYYGEFEVTYMDATIETYPNPKYIYVMILADAG